MPTSLHLLVVGGLKMCAVVRVVVSASNGFWMTGLFCPKIVKKKSTGCLVEVYVPRPWGYSSSGTLVLLHMAGCSLGVVLLMLVIVEYI